MITIIILLILAQGFGVLGLSWSVALVCSSTGLLVGLSLFGVYAGMLRHTTSPKYVSS